MFGYEWTHYLVHSDYRPRSRWYRSVWRNHRLHHYKNEHYWFTVTSAGTADRLFGTYPADPAAVRPSPTVKALHALEESALAAGGERQLVLQRHRGRGRRVGHLVADPAGERVGHAAVVPLGEAGSRSPSRIRVNRSCRPAPSRAVARLPSNRTAYASSVVEVAARCRPGRTRG